ncbi:hypothetical protein ER615_08720 [Streptococcus pyogenes]|nr:hypothetical protein ER615_08720 [Streptococcus pyogenes]
MIGDQDYYRVCKNVPLMDETANPAPLVLLAHEVLQVHKAHEVLKVHKAHVVTRVKQENKAFQEKLVR